MNQSGATQLGALPTPTPEEFALLQQQQLGPSGFLQLAQKLAALSTPGLPPPPNLQQRAQQLQLSQQILPQNQLTFANVLQIVHAYWKSKVLEVHSHWKKLPDSFDTRTLDKRNLSIDKKFENCKVPSLKLGNKVKIVSSMDKRTFKALHKKVGIWKEGLTKYIGKEAIVMDLSSKFLIGVCMIENGERKYFHGFALEVVDEEVNEGIWENTTDFKVNDEVIIGVELGVLAHLQKPWTRTPSEIAAQLVGLIGRVMGCCEGGVLVTFDEMQHEILSPAALRLHSNGKRKAHLKTPGENIKKGTRVRVHHSIAEVIRNQRGHGEWDYKMTKFVGKLGVVAETVEGGDAIVNFTPFESYRMNKNSLDVLKKNGSGERKSGIQSPFDPFTRFAVGDVVRLNIGSDDLQSNLQLLRIPMEFLLMGESFGEFVGYMGDARGVVNFGDGTEFIFNTQLLTKVGEEMTKQFKKMRKQDKAIRIGSKVMLWIGPMTFVKKCLKTFKEGFEKALTEEACVMGYDDAGNAVIKYEDGHMYIIPDECLCSPREIWQSEQIKQYHWEREPVELPRNFTALEATLLHSVTEVLKANKETSALKWKSSLIKGNNNDSTTIVITFPCQLEDFEKFVERLKSKLATEEVYPEFKEGIYAIFSRNSMYRMVFKFKSGEGDTEREMKIPAAVEQQTETQKSEGSSFKGPPLLHRESSVNESTGPPLLHRESSVNESTGPPLLHRASSVTESAGSQNLAVPTPLGQGVCNIPIPAGVSQVILQIGNNPQVHQGTPQPRPSLVQPQNQASGMIVNPQTTINMFSEGRNQLNISSSYVREVNTE